MLHQQIQRLRHLYQVQPRHLPRKTAFLSYNLYCHLSTQKPLHEEPYSPLFPSKSAQD